MKISGEKSEESLDVRVYIGYNDEVNIYSSGRKKNL